MKATQEKGVGSMDKGRRRMGREVWYLLYLPIYLLLFVLVEQLVTDNYWVSWCTLDDRIPFVRQFVLIYVLWYPLMLGTTLYLLFKDRRAFVRYARSVVLGLTACMLIFLLLPSGQELRPAEVPGNDLSSRLLRLIYAADTNTNVFPSMHVVGTLAAVIAIFDSRSASLGAKWGVAALGVLINASTVLIKQHSVLDIFAGIALYALVYLAVYRLPELSRGSRLARPCAARNRRRRTEPQN